MRKKDGNLFDEMLMELENAVGKPLDRVLDRGQPRAEGRPLSIELSLRGVQLTMLPFMSMADALRNEGVGGEILHSGTARLSVEDFQDLQAVFLKIDELCKRVAKLEQGERDTTDPRFPRS
jgi:hypothetical protein